MTWKNWPKYLKILGVISGIIAALTILYSTISIVFLFLNPTNHPEIIAFIVLVSITLPILITILPPWILGLLSFHYAKKKKRTISNIFLIIGLFIFLTALLISIGMSEGGSIDSFVGLGFRFIGLSVIEIIIFIILLVKINRFISNGGGATS